jgi:hypothetical protein
MRPARKSPAIESLLDEVSERMFGRKRTEAIRAGICVDCGQAVVAFRNALSYREYAISGLCQRCQDEVFGKTRKGG